MKQKMLDSIKLANIVLSEIERLAPKLYPLLEFEKVEMNRESMYRVSPPTGEAKEIQTILLSKYISWSKDVSELLNVFYPHKLEAFKSAYFAALPYLDLKDMYKCANSHSMQFEFIKYLTEQRTILSHLFAKISSMPISKDETIPIPVFTETDKRFFRKTIKPVLEKEIENFKKELIAIKGNNNALINQANQLLIAVKNDSEDIKSKCISFRKLC